MFYLQVLHFTLDFSLLMFKLDLFQWQWAPEHPITLYFPEDNLMKHLLDLYFVRINLFVPVLHRPTFERSVAERLHTRNQHFGNLVLSVCAMASRCSDDPRVFSDVAPENTEQSSGWKWFRQIRPIKDSFFDPPSVYELQMYCVRLDFLFLVHYQIRLINSYTHVQIAIMYLQGTSTPEACWPLLGLGVRFAQDVGAHRKKSNERPTVEGETWKRAFWSLITIDVFMSAGSGRPRATNSNEYVHGYAALISGTHHVSFQLRRRPSCGLR